MLKPQKKFSQKGFTVTELMISTAVFGLVLLAITTAILQLTRVYYKGVTETKVQATARNLVDSISQAIQFSGEIVTATTIGPSPGTSYAFCVGDTQYSYTVGYQVDDTPTSSQTYHALVAYDIPRCNSSTAPQDVRQATVNGREILEPKMRLSKIDITNVGGEYYRISVRIAYGDDDLLYSPSDPGNANGYNLPDATCKSQRVGTQFCAVSDITAAVTKRVK
jgi:prepilin-type N-terminal cleavage/methylation domain-containing protein